MDNVQLRREIRNALVIMGRALAEESQKYGELPPMTLKDVHMYRDMYKLIKGDNYQPMLDYSTDIEQDRIMEERASRHYDSHFTSEY